MRDLNEEEGSPLLHHETSGDSNTGWSWTSKRALCVVFGLMAVAGLAGAVTQHAGASLGDGQTLPTVLTPAEHAVGDPVVKGIEAGYLTNEKPFTAMEGMFAYDRWTQSLFEETQDDRPLLQQLPRYGATVDWSQIKSSINSGIGKSGQRKLFLFIRHGKATHNEWGKLQDHAHEAVNIPCDFRKPGDLVDPELTEVGKTDTNTFVHDVFKSGLGAEIGKKAKIFSSPLSRCMQTTLLLLHNQTGLEVENGKVTVSELLRERIDARVPFELRRPVSFVPESVLKANAAAAAAAAVTAEQATQNPAGFARLAGHGGATGVGGTCWEPSKGLTGHEGSCCVDSGLVEKFGDTRVFDINVATPSFLNIEVTEQDANLDPEDTPQTDGTGEPAYHHTKQYKYVGASCGLTEVAARGWQTCTGPEMLGLLAEDDLALGGKEEDESALVERVRTWFSSVFDSVESNVVIAVTHSDWIKLALSELDIKKPWVVPKNSEIFPIIVEDTRTSVPGWIEKREQRKRQVNHASEKDGIIDLTHSVGVHEKVLNAIKMSDDAANKAAGLAAEAQRAAATQRQAAEAAKVAADQAKVAEDAAARVIADAAGAQPNNNQKQIITERGPQNSATPQESDYY